MRNWLVILTDIFIVGLFLYSKLLPYKDKLNPNYKSIFNFFNGIFNPVFNLLKKFFKPYHVGGGVGVDMTQIVLLIIILIIQTML
ncbi:MAG: YggT family protein [Bacteroidetes bacterium]|nr:YggT family protein [Bacteroidota bacterium]